MPALNRPGAGPLAVYEFAMMTFVNTHSKGLTILATHRLVKGLANFNFEKFRDSVSAFFDWYSYPFQDAEERKEAIHGLALLARASAQATQQRGASAKAARSYV